MTLFTVNEQRFHNSLLQVYDFAMKEAAHLLVPNSGDEKETQRKKKKKNR